jgi:hypothetical protein
VIFIWIYFETIDAAVQIAWNATLPAGLQYFDIDVECAKLLFEFTSISSSENFAFTSNSEAVFLKLRTCCIPVT